uniref:Uncharacterized protein n=1 Tax=Oryza sativa subsp. japonica TaxID=39947 RepID=Q6H4Z8_ORYSJ|nr:hypothetical protein [Oryza sativa Japonica Group]BAD27609.1 hypothetical protein [Oryza sativa Japonica Group]
MPLSARRQESQRLPAPTLPHWPTGWRAAACALPEGHYSKPAHTPPSARRPLPPRVFWIDLICVVGNCRSSRLLRW